MASVNWNGIKTWIAGEFLDIGLANEQLSENLQWLYEKNVQVTQYAGVSDIVVPVTNTGFVETGIEVGILKVDSDTTLRISLNFSLQLGTSGDVRLDFLVDDAIYASTRTATPDSSGLRTFRNLADYQPIVIDTLIEGVASGYHTVKLVGGCSVASTNLTFNLTNTVGQIVAEEYGKPQVTYAV